MYCTYIWINGAFSSNTSAVCVRQVRESPDVSNAHWETDARQKIFQFWTPVPSIISFIVTILCFCVAVISIHIDWVIFLHGKIVESTLLYMIFKFIFKFICTALILSFGNIKYLYYFSHTGISHILLSLYSLICFSNLKKENT